MHQFKEELFNRMIEILKETEDSDIYIPAKDRGEGKFLDGWETFFKILARLIYWDCIEDYSMISPSIVGKIRKEAVSFYNIINKNTKNID
ncbi:MAG: hypothetical protein RLY43_975 [Bacteroidota bacterium]